MFLDFKPTTLYIDIPLVPRENNFQHDGVPAYNAHTILEYLMHCFQIDG
jgi:hypothetical protein